MYNHALCVCPENDHFIATFTTCSELRKVLFLAPSVCGFLFVNEISPELLNGFVANSHGRRVNLLLGRI